MKQILFILCLVIGGITYADTPLTSISISEAYENNKMVIEAGENGMNKKVLSFLTNKSENSVLKVAIINQLMWGDISYIETFEKHLLSEHKGLKPKVFDYLRTVVAERAGASEDEKGKSIETEQTKLLTADDLMCWAYFQALFDYSDLREASGAAYIAFARDKKSMAHATIMALISCEIMFSYDFCEVYRVGHFYFVETKYEKNILNQTGVDLIMGYLNMYEGYCEKEG